MGKICCNVAERFRRRRDDFRDFTSPTAYHSDVVAPLCLGFIPTFLHHPTEDCETNPISHLFSVYVCTTGLVEKHEWIRARSSFCLASLINSLINSLFRAGYRLSR